MIGSADNQSQPAYLSWDALNQIMRNMKAPQFDYDGFKMIYDANPDIQPLIKNFDNKGLTLATKIDNDEPEAGVEPEGGDEVDTMAQRATNKALS
jgi:hypothetical protein